MTEGGSPGWEVLPLGIILCYYLGHQGLGCYPEEAEFPCDPKRGRNEGRGAGGLWDVATFDD